MRTTSHYPNLTLSRSGSPLLRAFDFSSNLPPPPLPALETRWALFLDVDGTLLDLAPTPDAVKIPDGLIDLLTRLYQRLDGALALISGRRIRVLDALFAPLRLPCAGLHGFEWRNADEEGHAKLDDAALDAMRSAAQRVAEALPAVLVEDKDFSVAFHFRQAKLQQAPLRARVEEIARRTGFVIQSGIDVYELRPPGTDKGSALGSFMRHAPFRQRVPIYIGDDLTDEHALTSVQKLAGVGIHVGTVMPSAARFGLANPSAVLNWLRRWEEQLS